MIRLSGRAMRVTVFIGEYDTWHHKPLYSGIVHRAHRTGRQVLRRRQHHHLGRRRHLRTRPRLDSGRGDRSLTRPPTPPALATVGGLNHAAASKIGEWSCPPLGDKSDR